MQFIHQALTWGFLLALVPLLIHLINMMRHRRVRWAAMEFLLASYKKHRKWIWLKQLLLLLARMAAVALVVAMLAQLKTRDQWLAIFGGRVTLERTLRTFDATQLAVGRLEALTALRQLLGEARDETSIVYLLSDFRQKDWGSPAELREALGQLRRSQAEIHLVNCGRSTEP